MELQGYKLVSNEKENGYLIMNPSDKPVHKITSFGSINKATAKSVFILWLATNTPEENWCSEVKEYIEAIESEREKQRIKREQLAITKKLEYEERQKNILDLKDWHHGTHDIDELINFLKDRKLQGKTKVQVCYEYGYYHDIDKIYLETI